MRQFFATAGAFSKDGNEAFQKYLENFENKPSWSETKKSISEGMAKFLGLTKRTEGEDE